LKNQTTKTEILSVRQSKTERRIRFILVFIFILAMVMGPGPGLRLVNPEPNGTSDSLLFLGIPTIYAWGLFWYGVQAAVVITASLTIWREKEE
tara:strand:- start:344 stop:622 length:279 start_codon:yes stop_codon:yes gene_type:complete